MLVPTVLDRTTAPPEPDPVDTPAVLTDRSRAVRAAYRLAHALRALDDDERDDVLGLLYLELADPSA